MSLNESLRDKVSIKTHIIYHSGIRRRNNETGRKIEKENAALSDRHIQILALLSEEAEYSAEEIAEILGLKGSRTRQLYFLK